MTRTEMMARMPASEFHDWMRIDKIEPFGDRRLDLLCGILGSLLANIHWRRDGDPPFVPKDFMPDFDQEEPEEQSTEEQARLLDMFFQHATTDS